MKLNKTFLISRSSHRPFLAAKIEDHLMILSDPVTAKA
jgi:hypothetical protein